jgi:hypothetical protein
MIQLISADHINQLLYPFSTTERAMLPIPAKKGRPPTGRFLAGPYTVRHPALLDQIENTVTGSTTAGQTFHAAYGSKPAGRLDCLQYMARIDKQSLQLAGRYHIALCPLRPRLGQIAGRVGLATNSTVTGWWVSARVLTQHDGPPVSPNVPCPVEDCDVRGSLRVRFDPNVAMCTHCGMTWSDGATDPVESFGRLVVWVRWAADHLAGPEHVVQGEQCDECAVERTLRAERTVIRMALLRTGRVGVGHGVVVGQVVGVGGHGGGATGGLLTSRSAPSHGVPPL